MLDAAIAGQLTESQWQQLHQLSPETVTLVGLVLGRRIAQLQGNLNTSGPANPATPSGQQ